MENEKKATASSGFDMGGIDSFAFDKPLPPEPQSASALLDDFLKAEAGDIAFKDDIGQDKGDLDDDFGGFEATDDFARFDSPRKANFGKTDVKDLLDDFLEDTRSGGVGESPPLTPKPDYDFIARENSPLPREPSPLSKEATPSPKRPSPSPPREATPPSLKEPTPSPKELTPSPKEPTPPPKEPTPPPKEPTPPPKEPTPPPKEPTPPPKEPTPPREPTPPPKQPTPPPKEPTPPPREPTPPPKEPTPPPKLPTPPREPTPPLREPTPPLREPTPTPPPTPITKDPSPVKEVKSAPVKERPASASDIAPKDLFANIGLVESLVYWRDLKKSGVVFGITLACLLSLVYCSLISVVSYLCLLSLFATVSFRIYKNIMQAVQKTSDGHPFKDLLEIDIEIKEDKAKEAATAVVAHVNSWATELRRLFLVVDLVDSLKFGVCLWALTYVGALFNGLSLIILCWIALFTLPKVYENNKQQIDASLELANAKLSEITNKVKAALPGKKEEKKDQ